MFEDILEAFGNQGADVVYVARCCNRTYFGLEVPTKCRTCDQPPGSQKITLGPHAAKDLAWYLEYVTPVKGA